MSGVYAGHGRTGTFSAYRNCVQILAIWDSALPCWNTSRWQWINGTIMGLGISSRYLCIQIAIDKMQLCWLSVAYACPYHNPSATMEHSVLPSAQYSWNWDSSVKSTLLQRATGHQRWAFAHWQRTAVSSNPGEDGEHADELPWDSFWQFVQNFLNFF